MTRVAVIDCGSNSFRLLIADKTPEKLLEVKKEIRTVRLGEGLTRERSIISASAQERAFSALREYKRISESFSSDYLVCLGTSALRSSDNSQDFVQAVKEKVGISLQIISGAQEGELSFKGATGCFEGDSYHGLAVLDIGGGSTELLLAEDGRLKALSLPLGAVRLTNQFIQHDPPTANELQRLRRYVHSIWDEALSDNYQVTSCIGVAGTITNLAAIKLKLKDYDPDKVQGSLLTFADLGLIIDKLRSINHENRQSITGLQPERADIIIAGSYVLWVAMLLLELDSIEVSDRDLLHAVAWDFKHYI